MSQGTFKDTLAEQAPKSNGKGTEKKPKGSLNLNENYKIQQNTIQQIIEQSFTE